MRKKLSLNTSEKKEKMLSEGLREFLLVKKVHNLSEATLDYYQNCYHKLDLFLQRDIHLKEINQMLIDEFILHLKKSGIKAITINTQLNGIRAFLKYCQELGYVDNLVVIPKIKQEQPLKETYTDSELSILLTKPSENDFTEYRDWIIVNMLLGTGIRSKTLCNLKISDVDLTENELRCSTMKNRIPQILPISKSLKKVLLGWVELRLKQTERDNTKWLFPSLYDQQLNKDSLSHSLRKYNLRRGINKTGVHLWRHTFAKKWILAGGDIFRLQKILNHKDMDMVRTYVNMFNTDLITDFDKLNPLEQVTYKKSKLRY